MQEYVEGFFELVTLSDSDIVYDLGCGDGRLLFAALEKGAGRCVGIDLDSWALSLARESAKAKGVEDHIVFIESDFMESDVSDATVLLCYLFPEAMRALEPKFETELKPGTRIVSEAFTFPDWKENKTIEVHHKRFHLYIMPPEPEK